MKNILFIVLLLGCLVACKRPDNSYAKLDPEVDAFLSFDGGSYWIYQDSVTGQIDSLFLDKLYNMIYTNPDEEKYQQKYYNLYQYRDNVLVGRWIYRTLFVSTYYSWNSGFDTLTDGSHSYSEIFSTNDIVNRHMIYDPANYIGTYETGAQLFDSVYQFVTSTSYHDTVIYCLKKEVGPISIEFIQDNITIFNYKLLRYHTIPVP